MPLSFYIQKRTYESEKPKEKTIFQKGRSETAQEKESAHHADFHALIAAGGRRISAF